MKQFDKQEMTNEKYNDFLSAIADHPIIAKDMLKDDAEAIEFLKWYNDPKNKIEWLREP
jgi:hypothetical protein